MLGGDSSVGEKIHGTWAPQKSPVPLHHPRWMMRTHGTEGSRGTQYHRQSPCRVQGTCEAPALGLCPGHGVDRSPRAQPTLMSQLTTLCPVSLPSNPWLGERSKQMLFLQAWKKTPWEHPHAPGCVPDGTGGWDSSPHPAPRGVGQLSSPGGCSTARVYC